MVDIFSLVTLTVVRLQTIYRPFLLLRMKNTLLDSERLIELQKKAVDLVKLEFRKRRGRSIRWYVFTPGYH